MVGALLKPSKAILSSGRLLETSDENSINFLYIVASGRSGLQVDTVPSFCAGRGERSCRGSVASSMGWLVCWCCRKRKKNYRIRFRSNYTLSSLIFDLCVMDKVTSRMGKTCKATHNGALTAVLGDRSCLISFSTKPKTYPFWCSLICAIPFISW